MRKLFLASFLLVTTITLFSQSVTEIDSLENELYLLEGKPKVKALNRLSYLLLEQNDSTSEKLAREALALAKSLGDWKGQALAHDNLGRFYLKEKVFLHALDAFRSSTKISAQINDVIGLAKSKTHLGETYLLLSDFDQAKQLLREAVDLYDPKNNDIGLAKAYDLLGRVNLGKQQFSNAKKYFKNALVIWEARNNIKNAEHSVANIALVAFELGDLDGALANFQTASAYAIQSNDDKGNAFYLEQQATVFLKKKDFKAAQAINEPSYAINLKLGNTFGLANNELIFGEIALALGERGSCFEHVEKAAKLIEKLPISPEKIHLLDKVADISYVLDDHEKAQYFGEAALATQKAVLTKELADFQKTRHELLSEKIEFGNQSDRIKLLEELNSNNQKIRTLVFVLLGVAGLMAALAYILYQKYLGDNQKLLTQNEEINQKKTELNEMNHELEMTNTSLALLNKKLVEEIAERESLERSSFARDRFLATMSHEMRTPLNVIIGMAHLLREDNPRPDQAEQLRALQFASNELVVFINEVLDFSKIEAGKLDLKSREFNLNETADAVFNSFVKKAEDKGLLFYCAFDSHIPKKLMGDESRAFQILTNLLTNCLDSTEKGMIQAEVFLEDQDDLNIIVKIVVEGTDGGVGRAVLSDGYHPWSGEESQHESFDPRQLALAITKRLIELQRGRLDVQSLYGEATRFTALIPFKASFSIDQNPNQGFPSDHSHLAGSHILVVEDNKINQCSHAMACQSLQRMTVLRHWNRWKSMILT
jgi:signal transduction histidine kinase/TolA-binding protein